jgi:exopolysaccharide biosynthesis polyprenyl glycosylphosphotransferase
LKNNTSSVYNIFLVIGDLVALFLAFGVAYIIRSHFYTTAVAHPIHALTYVGVFLALLPFWIIIFALIGLYNQYIYEKRFQEFGLLLIGSFLGLLFVVFWNFLSLHPIFPAKLVPIYGFILSFIFLIIFRNLARYVRTKLYSYGIGINNVLLIGNTEMTSELVDSLGNYKTTGYKISGVVGSKQLFSKLHHVNLFSNFAEVLESKKLVFNTIIQTELYTDEHRNREILEYAQVHHVAYRFVPGNTELFVGNIDVELFRNSVPVIAVHQTALIGWGRIFKRLFDIIFGVILLIITSPLIILIFIAELLSGGQAFFRQERLTRFNTSFRVFKFRTLKKSSNGMTPETAFTRMGRPELIEVYRANGDQIENDPRFSRLGRILRRGSLDELPQLFNVIRGDISLVGPRPITPKELSVYEKRHAILSVKSGVTGLAQVSGRKNISFDERRKLDLYYVQNWTFWLDLVILAKTIRVILDGS